MLQKIGRIVCGPLLPPGHVLLGLPRSTKFQVNSFTQSTLLSSDNTPDPFFLKINWKKWVVIFHLFVYFFMLGYVIFWHWVALQRYGMVGISPTEPTCMNICLSIYRQPIRWIQKLCLPLEILKFYVYKLNNELVRLRTTELSDWFLHFRKEGMIAILI